MNSKPLVWSTYSHPSSHRRTRQSLKLQWTPSAQRRPDPTRTSGQSSSANWHPQRSKHHLDPEMWRTCLHPMASACPRHAVVLRSSQLSCSGRAACLSSQCCCMQRCTSPHLDKRSLEWEEWAIHLASYQARQRKSSCNRQPHRCADSPCRHLPRAFHLVSSRRGSCS